MLLVREKTYSISEFVGYLNDKELDKLDREVKLGLKKMNVNIEKYLYNPKTSKLLITLVASMMHYAPAFADASNAVVKIRNAGDMLFGICREASYSICIVMCCIDILSALLRKDTKAVSKIIAIYIMSFAGLYFLPWIFDMIREIFG